MNLDRRDLKLTAKSLMRTTEPKPIWVGLVYVLILYVISMVSSRLAGTVYEVDYNILYSGGDMMNAVTFHPENFNGIYRLLVLALELVSAVLSAGFAIYTLQVIRRLPSGFGNLFDGFGIFFRVVWLNILMGLFIMLWTFLLIVPGIIASYSYRQALYLLLDHPEWSALRCIRESKALMRGHKWELFVLDLSFLGWWILSVIPFVSMYVEPYTGLTYAEYYNRLAGMPAAAEPDGESWSGGSGEKPPWEY